MDRDWAALPRELLNFIVERLETPKEFSFVCKSWRSAAKDIQTHCAVTTTPMILISSDAEEDKWHLYDPVDDKVLKTQLNLGRQIFCGSSKGWLIVVDENGVVSLINPFLFGAGGRKDHEKSIIRLPPLSHVDLNRLHHGYHFVYKATISEDPILNADNCIVMVMFLDMYSLAFIRLNKDSKWTYVPETDTVDRRRWRSIDEVVKFEDRFYLVDYFGQPYSFDVTTQSVSPDSPAKMVVGKYGVEEDYNCKECLVVCNEKTVLIVRRCMEDCDDDETKTKRFRVFELNVSKDEWTEKNTLGDVALFLGNNSSISVCASKSGYRANCIYFIHDHLEFGLGPRGAFDYGVYNVEEKRFLENPFHGDAVTLMSKTDVPPIWILPTYKL